ncbi:hypothetical protein RRG08_041675 [Elysia crispata]|uniref:Uncharacterized protein n=1 Tax=Elysia crispata TaxID=231223 RepID=A0AAE0YC55_9GAST|nr:hypothetical protein RRG08_041675 [Elysia crispata]
MDTQGYPRQLMTMMQERIFSRSGKCHSTIKKIAISVAGKLSQMTVTVSFTIALTVAEYVLKQEPSVVSINNYAFGLYIVHVPGNSVK